MVKKLKSLKIAAAAFLLSGALHAQWIAGYYESQNGVEPVSSIPWNKYTEVIHFAASTDGSGGVILHWLSQSEIQQLVAAGHQAGKKVIVCIQDNGSNLNAFSSSTAPGTINTFVNNIASFVNSNGYDGVDIDWEQNINGTQLAQLFQLLRSALGSGKVISAAMNNETSEIQAASSAASYVDQFNVMCYDMDTPGNGYSWYNDALLQNGNSSVMTCDWRVNPFLNAGVPASKIGIGLPFYGRRWQGVTKALVNGNFSTSTVLYNQLVTDSTRWQSQYQNYDSGYKSNYLSIASMNEFDSYTGTQTIQDAASWIKSKGFGGAMTFSLYYEFLSGQSGDAQYPLSAALYSALGGGSSSSSSSPTVAGPVVSGGSPTGSLASSTTQTTMSVLTNENATCKYATAAGTAYSSMPNTFSSTGGTSHSTTITGLQSGSSYNYYVRCADSSGNADTSDYGISFSVSSTSSSGGGGAPAALTATASPNSGSGSSQTFTFQVSDPGGYAAISELDTFIGTQAGGTNNCRVQYDGGSTLYLQNDAASSWLQGTMGSSSTLQNSQCSVNLAGSSASGSGYNLTLKFALTFTSAYNGTKSIYALAADSSTNTGWLTLGTWTVGGSGGSSGAPPVISNGAPAGTLAFGTTQATMSVVTNENATCKFATKAGTAYGSMPNTFKLTGGTMHSTTVTGLTNGGNYNYYVRCADSSGNADTSDYTIAFSVSRKKQ